MCMWFCRFLALFAAVCATGAYAASITRATSPNCVLDIKGPIVAGDYEAFVKLADENFIGHATDEATSKDLVCLNSNGGSLVEGVRFARHCYEKGVGAVIDAGQQCLSSCAIMFMSGTAQGAEVSYANRQLHVGGRLGFHRPFIKPTGGDDTPETLAASYDRALQSALDLIAIGNRRAPWTNSPMIKADLFEQMLMHTGDEMFMIDTVDKVGRWDIQLFGYADPTLLSEEQAFYACENSLQWQVGLTGGDITYTRKIATEVHGGKRVRQVRSFPLAYEVEGLGAGYVYEGCVIVLDQKRVSGCGIDENMSIILGDGRCDGSSFMGRLALTNPIAVFNPATRIADLERSDKSSGPEKTTRCVVRNAGGVIDSEPCTVEEDVTKVKDALVTTYVWPSGARTVIVRHVDSVELNGVPSEETISRDWGRCFDNSRTGNQFCVVWN